mgnify:CR=1 FL=1
MSEAPEDPDAIFVWTTCNVYNYTRRKRLASRRWLFGQWWELQTCKCSSVSWSQAAKSAKCSIEGKKHSAAWELSYCWHEDAATRLYSEPWLYKWASIKILDWRKKKKIILHLHLPSPGKNMQNNQTWHTEQKYFLPVVFCNTLWSEGTRISWDSSSE